MYRQAIKIRFFAGLRDIAGVKEEDIILSNHTSIKNLLKCLSRKYGSPFFNYLYDENETVRSNLQFLLNGKNIETLNSFETELQDGDEFAIIPPMSGG